MYKKERLLQYKNVNSFFFIILLCMDTILVFFRYLDLLKGICSVMRSDATMTYLHSLSCKS